MPNSIKFINKLSTNMLIPFFESIFSIEGTEDILGRTDPKLAQHVAREAHSAAIIPGVALVVSLVWALFEVQASHFFLAVLRA